MSREVDGRRVAWSRLAARLRGAGAGQVRIAAIVIVATMVLWMLGSWLGGRLGLPARFAFLVDFSALAAFFWALVVLVRAGRRVREREGR
ncbi:MAG: DUF5337 family protein [Rhodobacteraceae bacterium]|nr:DUF5337 family protein [Paracoccaceae bacterium]